jgi:hypothetical protein
MYIRKIAVGLLIGWVALVGCSSSTPTSVAEVQNKAAALVAAPKLPAIFGDDMVLQQGKAIPVWGGCGVCPSEEDGGRGRGWQVDGETGPGEGWGAV